MSSGDIGEERVGQESRHESAGVCDLAAIDGTVQHMVLQDSGKKASVGSKGRECRIVDLCKCCIGWGENSNILSISKGLDKLRVESKDTAQ